MDSAKKFKNALNNGLADYGGVFLGDIKDYQLQPLLKNMSRNLFLDHGKIQKTVTVVGRQFVDMHMDDHNPEDDVYVFNETVQVCYILN